MIGCTSRRSVKGTTVSFRRKETQEQFLPDLNGGQVSRSYKCRRSSKASYADMRLVPEYRTGKRTCKTDSNHPNRLVLNLVDKGTIQ